MLGKLLIVLILIFLSGCGAIPELPESNEPAYRALLIGVGWGNLQSPPYNVDRMSEIFSNCKFTEEEIEFLVIDKLKDSDATKENALNSIVSTFADADDNDISYFYWMGHGGLKQGIPVLIPHDYDMTLKSAITIHELESALSSISGTKVVIIETCHSGNFIGKSQKNFNNIVIDIFSAKTKDLLISDQYQVLTACKGSQLCWSSEGGEAYGFFNMAFYEGCQELKADEDEDEVINLLEMRNYIRNWTSLHCWYSQEVQMYPDNSVYPIVEY